MKNRYSRVELIETDRRARREMQWRGKLGWQLCRSAGLSRVPGCERYQPTPTADKARQWSFLIPCYNRVRGRAISGQLAEANSLFFSPLLGSNQEMENALIRRINRLWIRNLLHFSCCTTQKSLIAFQSFFTFAATLSRLLYTVAASNGKTSTLVDSCLRVNNCMEVFRLRSPSYMLTENNRKK